MKRVRNEQRRRMVIVNNKVVEFLGRSLQSPSTAVPRKVHDHHHHHPRLLLKVLVGLILLCIVVLVRIMNGSLMMVPPYHYNYYLSWSPQQEEGVQKRNYRQLSTTRLPYEKEEIYNNNKLRTTLENTNTPSRILSKDSISNNNGSSFVMEDVRHNYIKPAASTKQQQLPRQHHQSPNGERIEQKQPRDHNDNEKHSQEKTKRQQKKKRDHLRRQQPTTTRNNSLNEKNTDTTESNTTTPKTTIGEEEVRSEGEGFAACLLVMDANHFLIEWLAYHYVTLPLRRLIVAVDPYSKSSPTSILNRYRTNNLIEITEWTDSDFLPETYKKQINHDVEFQHAIRQDLFLLQCMKTLKSEQKQQQQQLTVGVVNGTTRGGRGGRYRMMTPKWTWTTHIDTDEYIVWNNRHVEPDYQLVDTTTTIRRQTVLERLNNHKHKFRRQDGRNGTITTACRPMGRLNVGTTESNETIVQQGVPHGWNGSDFVTMRYTWPEAFTSKRGQRRLPGKAMIDLSQTEKDDFIFGNTNPHRMLKSHCLPEMMWIRPTQSPFIVYHYTGTWEQFSFRQGGARSTTRSRRAYDQRQYHDWQDVGAIAGTGGNNQSSSPVRTWFYDFVNELGRDVAMELLHGAGQVMMVEELSSSSSKI